MCSGQCGARRRHFTTGDHAAYEIVLVKPWWLLVRLGLELGKRRVARGKRESRLVVSATLACLPCPNTSGAVCERAVLIVGREVVSCLVFRVSDHRVGYFFLA